MKFTIVVCLLSLSDSLSWASPSQVELHTVPLFHSDHSGVMQRACAIGFRELRAFFQSSGAQFDRKLVHSHKGFYCHIFYKPSVQGFRAVTMQDPATAVMFETGFAPAVQWSEAFARRADRAVRSIPVAPNVIAEPDWRSVFVEGVAEGQPLLLFNRKIAPDALSIPSHTSRLPWDARDVAIVGDVGKTMLLYGDSLRESWHGLNEEERAFVLRAEFGVDEAFHVPTGGRRLGEVLVVGESGGLALVESIPATEAVHLRTYLRRRGIAPRDRTLEIDQIAARVFLLRKHR